MEYLKTPFKSLTFNFHNFSVGTPSAKLIYYIYKIESLSRSMRAVKSQSFKFSVGFKMMKTDFYQQILKIR